MLGGQRVPQVEIAALLHFFYEKGRCTGLEPKISVLSPTPEKTKNREGIIHSLCAAPGITIIPTTDLLFIHGFQGLRKIVLQLFLRDAKQGTGRGYEGKVIQVVEVRKDADFTEGRNAGYENELQIGVAIL